MKTDTWMPLYIGDYLGDTIGLSFEEHGAYLMAMMAYWRKGGPLTEREANGAVGGNKQVLERFFNKHSGFWRHKRIDLELEKASIVAMANSERAKTAAHARWTQDRNASSNAISNPSSTNGECLDYAPSQSQSPSPIQNTNHYHKDTRTVLHFLNEASRRPFRETDSNLTFISSRLKEPEVTLEGVKEMILRQCKKWLDTTMADFLRPETLFNKTKFDGYYAAKSEVISTNEKLAVPRHVGGNF